MLACFRLGVCVLPTGMALRAFRLEDLRALLDTTLWHRHGDPC